MSTTIPRQTADERREAVLSAAGREFSRKGLHCASTDAIAKDAGISQPYLFRLFGTKKELYLAATARAMEETYQAFERALALPLHSRLTDADLDRVAEGVRRFA